MTKQVAVWIDHNEAKIFHVSKEGFERDTVHGPAHHLRRGTDTGPKGADRPETKHFFDEIARALREADEILIVGPSTAKLELLRHLHAHERALEPKVIGVETVDHPSDGQMAAYTRRYFADPVHRTPH
jgi:stalled ribosome rescue protein Dom34